jgi:hypothetical protein
VPLGDAALVGFEVIDNLFHVLRRKMKSFPVTKWQPTKS